MTLTAVPATEQTSSARKAAMPASAAIVLAADAVTKTAALNWGGAIANPGSGDHMKWLASSFPVVLVAALIYWASVWRTLPVHIGAGITAGGIAGNLADRLFRDGAIIDWLHVPISGNLVLIMNIADIAILAGIAIFISAAVSNIQKDRRRKGGEEE